VRPAPAISTIWRQAAVSEIAVQSGYFLRPIGPVKDKRYEGTPVSPGGHRGEYYSYPRGVSRLQMAGAFGFRKEH
jgi:hypothetical protein